MMPRFDEPPGLQALTRLVRDCSVSEVTRNVLLLRTDLLPPQLSRPHHLRLAGEALEPLGRTDRARTFVLAHGRLAIAWRGPGGDRLREAMAGLEHLLGDASAGAPPAAELARTFSLPEDGAVLLALAASPSAVEQRIIDAAPPPPPASALPPLTASMVDSMEDLVARGNVASFARHRTVFRLGPDGFDRAWIARALSLRALVAELAPGHDPFADPVLLRRLGSATDRRLMALMARGPELRDAGPFSLLLGVGSALSPEFLRLDNALPPGLRGQALIAFRPADVLANLAAFRFASVFLRARAFRVALRGLTPRLLELLDVSSLEADVLELRWSPALLGLDAAELLGTVGGRGRTPSWVLSGADEPAAFAWGRAGGVSFFEGRAVAGGTARSDDGRADPRSGGAGPGNAGQGSGRAAA